MNTATTYLELEITVSGTYERAEPDVGIMSGGWAFDDLIGIEVARYAKADGRTVRTATDLLDGVDLKCPGVIRLLNNICDVIGDSACHALAEAA